MPLSSPSTWCSASPRGERGQRELPPLLGRSRRFGPGLEEIEQTGLLGDDVVVGPGIVAGDLTQLAPRALEEADEDEQLPGPRQARAERRERQGTVKAELQEGGRSGDIVLRAEGITKSFGDNTVLQPLETTIERGDRVGIIGPNGAGKTTLLRILLGELQPDEGRVHTGTRLEVARFDQLADGRLAPWR